MNNTSDVCLIVEGAYPYITGGVLSWIQSLVAHLPDLTFTILHIGSRPDAQRKLLYTLPENVVELRELFISDDSRISKRHLTRQSSSAWQHFQTLHPAIAAGQPFDVNDVLSILKQPGLARLTTSDLFYAKESWSVLLKLYQQYAAGQPLKDFFWTFRSTYLPIFSLFEAPLPRARCYHAVSTGFSGLLGALAKIRTGRPFLLTEHGIYTREREIEIMQSSWIERLEPSYRISAQRMSFFQQWWFNTYRFMEQLSYDLADRLISITGVNQRYQLNRGVDPRKASIIPNGINTRRLAGLREQTTAPRCSQQFVVGFVGRVVPIKDVKTFIRAIKIASQTIPGLEVYLIGPTEEDAHYLRACQDLVELLNLSPIVHFTGPADVLAYYRQLDVLVLTSLSEGQPLVILEGNCAGIPVIATDVGACRELLMGITPEDQALGASGIITPVASPAETARAIIQLWAGEELRRRMGRAGQARVQRFYRQEQLYDAYRQLYQTLSLEPGGKF